MGGRKGRFVCRRVDVETVTANRILVILFEINRFSFFLSGDNDMQAERGNQRYILAMGPESSAST